MIIDGRKIASEIIYKIKEEIILIKEKSRISPSLALVRVGNDFASGVYVRNKVLKCEQVGIITKKYEYNCDTQTKVITDKIKELNSDENIHAILVQLPLPSNIDKNEVINSIDTDKDVDSFTYKNIGKYVYKNSFIYPCTTSGILHLIKSTGEKISQKKAIVIGRSEIVGKPTAMALLNEDATVVIAHSKTKFDDLKEFCMNSDILISAVGKKDFISREMVKTGAIVIDVGINRTFDNKIYGDVSFSEVYDKVSFITPVPGGVGPMTIAYLIKNTFILFKNYLQRL